MQVHFAEVNPGAAIYGLRAYLRALATLAHQPMLMLEHLNRADYIRKIGENPIAPWNSYL